MAYESNFYAGVISRPYNRKRLEEDETWMQGVLIEAQEAGASGALLQNMINQYFFADALQREREKAHWVSRVMHPRPPKDYFPNGAQMRKMMEMLQ